MSGWVERPFGGATASAVPATSSCARTGGLCDSKGIAGFAFGKQCPERSPLRLSEFVGGDATVAPKLQSLSFEMVHLDEDWSREEVNATVAAYFEMLARMSWKDAYRKSECDAQLRIVDRKLGPELHALASINLVCIQ